MYLNQYKDSIFKEKGKKEKEECDAKNRAYAFILKSGLLDEFRQWTEDHTGEDPHRLCMDIRERMADERQKRGQK